MWVGHVNWVCYLGEHRLQGLAREGISLTLISDLRTSLEVQWLNNQRANAGDLGSIPGLGRFHMLWGS